MYGHGFALLFLASRLRRGGRRRPPPQAGRHPDAAPSQVHAARPRRNARRLGLHLGEGRQQLRRGLGDHHPGAGPARCPQRRHLVPPEVIEKAVKYLQGLDQRRRAASSTAWRGGGGGDGRPALTAAAISCGFSAGEYNSPLVKKWFKFCQTARAASLGGGRFGHDEYTHYYYAQAIYILGEDGYGKLFPEADRGRPPDLEQVPQGTRSTNLVRTQSGRRQLDRRPRRPGLHHRRPPDHPAAGQRVPADLPTLIEPSSPAAKRRECFAALGCYATWLTTTPTTRDSA